MVNKEKLDLIEIFQILWRQKIFLMFCFLVPVIIALLVSLLLPKKYTSKAVILSPEVALGGGIIQTPFGGISTSGLGSLSERTISTQALMALLKSDRMVLDVINHFHLKEKLRVKGERALIKYVAEKMTSIELIPEEGVIEISVETNPKELSKAMVEFYLSNLEKLNTKFELTTQHPLVKIISPPYLPEKKSFPKTTINMGIAGVLGILFGLSYIYLKEKIS